MRRKPYTEIGVRRKKCVRCGERATYQWQMCSDGNVFRPLCAKCDVELNEMVMRWIWNDSREEDLRLYRENVYGRLGKSAPDK